MDGVRIPCARFGIKYQWVKPGEVLIFNLRIIRVTTSKFVVKINFVIVNQFCGELICKF